MSSHGWNRSVFGLGFLAEGRGDLCASESREDRDREDESSRRGGYARGDNAIPVPARKPASAGFSGHAFGCAATIFINDVSQIDDGPRGIVTFVSLRQC